MAASRGRNARRGGEARGVFLCAPRGRDRDGEFFLVEIADNGSGIPAEARPQIFTVPFFTTKGGSGTGLGLVISHRIVVERHHGKIDFSTGPDGTQFSVRLPFESSAHA